jgi:hypothetical protein
MQQELFAEILISGSLCNMPQTRAQLTAVLPSQRDGRRGDLSALARGDGSWLRKFQRSCPWRMRGIVVDAAVTKRYAIAARLSGQPQEHGR